MDLLVSQELGVYWKMEYTCFSPFVLCVPTKLKRVYQNLRFLSINNFNRLWKNFLVGLEGVEPPRPGCKPGALPLSYRPIGPPERTQTSISRFVVWYSLQLNYRGIMRRVWYLVVTIILQYPYLLSSNKWRGWGVLIPRLPPWQGGTLPLSYSPMKFLETVTGLEPAYTWVATKSLANSGHTVKKL